MDSIEVIAFLFWLQDDLGMLLLEMLDEKISCREFGLADPAKHSVNHRFHVIYRILDLIQILRKLPVLFDFFLEVSYNHFADITVDKILTAQLVNVELMALEPFDPVEHSKADLAVMASMLRRQVYLNSSMLQENVSLQIMESVETTRLAKLTLEWRQFFSDAQVLNTKSVEVVEEEVRFPVEKSATPLARITGCPAIIAVFLVNVTFKCLKGYAILEIIAQGTSPARNLCFLGLFG